MNIFIDLDGVLGDFFGHCFTQFGRIFDVDDYEERQMLFNHINQHEGFYATQPVHPNAYDIWDAAYQVIPSRPIVLTGCNPKGVVDVEGQKRLWVEKHFGIEVKTIVCPSRDKWKHGKRGDILVDDRTIGQAAWIGMGGLFIHHVNFVQTCMALSALRVTLRTGGKWPF